MGLLTVVLLGVFVSDEEEEGAGVDIIGLGLLFLDFRKILGIKLRPVAHTMNATKSWR